SFKATLWDAATGTTLSYLQKQSVDTTFAFSPDGTVLAIASWLGEDRGVSLWSVKDCKLRSKLLNGSFKSVAFSPDGRTLAASNADDRCIYLWNVTTGHLRKLEGHADLGRGLAFSPDSRTLASGGDVKDHTLRLWNLVSGKEILKIAKADEGLNSVQFAPDGRTVASAGVEGVVRLWEVATGKRILELTGHQRAVHSVAFTPDGRSLVSASGDHTLLVWGLNPPKGDSNPCSKELQHCWNDMGSEDATRAYEAIWTLSSKPQEAASYLGERLRGTIPRPEITDRIRRLIATLDSDEISVREKAFVELKKSGEDAETAIREALLKATSPEHRGRLQALVEELDSPVVGSAQTLQWSRAIWALEKMAAADVLEPVAAGSTSMRDRREAEAALRRLKR
ncbi:MAG: WD40 repeat domain-containing protein, partial [Acidobacteria bacterium]|nr:WD40 repeat domain-containing protein [Acidobacteriota bacterium]